MGYQPLAKPDFSLLEGARVYAPVDSGRLCDSEQRNAWNEALLKCAVRDERCTAQEAVNGLVSVFGGSKIDLSLTDDVSFDEAYRRATAVNPFVYIGTQIANFFADFVNFLTNLTSIFGKSEQHSGGRSNSATLALMAIIDQEIANRQDEPRPPQYEDALVVYEDC